MLLKSTRQSSKPIKKTLAKAVNNPASKNGNKKPPVLEENKRSSSSRSNGSKSTPATRDPTEGLSYISEIAVMEDHLQKARESLFSMEKANLKLQKSLKEFRPTKQESIARLVSFYQSKIREIEKTMDLIEMSNEIRDKENENPATVSRNDPYIEFQTRELFNRITVLEKTNFDQKILIKQLQLSLMAQNKMDIALEKLRLELQGKDEQIRKLSEDLAQREAGPKKSESNVNSSNLAVDSNQDKSNPEMPGKSPLKSRLIEGSRQVNQNHREETVIDRFVYDLHGIDDEIRRIEAELQASKETPV